MADGASRGTGLDDIGPEPPKSWRPPLWQIVVIGSGVVVVVALVFSFLEGPLSPKKVGTLGDWVGGLGTILAVCVALYESGASSRDRRDERVEDRDLARRAEAASVVAVIDLSSPVAHVEIRNVSGAPIRWVTLDGDLRGHEGQPLRVDPNPFPLDVVQLAPGEGRDVGLPIQSSRVSQLESSLTLRFVDIFDQRWVRSGPPPGVLRTEDSE